MLHAQLRVLSGKQQGNVISIAGSKFVVGREEDCHLRPNSDLISRHHCVIIRDNYTVRLRDLGSTNGTFVNGERIRGEVMLNPGDKLSIGKLEFEISIWADADTAPAAAAGGGAAGVDDMFANILAGAETISDSDTLSDLKTGKPVPTDATVTMNVSDLQEAAQAEAMEAAMGAEQQAGMVPAGMDPAAMAGQQMMGQQYGYPPGYGQQFYPQQQYMPYPQQPMMYPQMYPQQQYMPYPQQPMMYPQQGMPTPQQAAPEPAPEAAKSATGKVSIPEVRLPDPSETGAKAPAGGGGGAKGSSGPGVPDAATNIIKQYLNRRPGG